MDWNAANAELAKKLDARHVKEPPPGKYGQYLEAHHVISEANRIFGFDGWSYDVKEIRLTNEGEIALTDRRSGEEYQQLRVGYLATVTVMVEGVYRTDVGHGTGSGKLESAGDVHDSAVKEAVTDALKRALRTFGNPFGLALYDKTKADVEDRTAIEQVIANMGTIATEEELKGFWTDLYRNRRNLADHADVIAKKDELKASFAEKDAA